MEAEIIVMQPQAKGCQGLPEETGKTFPWRLQRELSSAKTLNVDVWSLDLWDTKFLVL